MPPEALIAALIAALGILWRLHVQSDADCREGRRADQADADEWKTLALQLLRDAPRAVAAAEKAADS